MIVVVVACPASGRAGSPPLRSSCSVAPPAVTAAVTGASMPQRGSGARSIVTVRPSGRSSTRRARSR
ncbi:hypothetical protein BJF78_08060 [Pseudonocardia sp. CNS-139]|nr:hypothetical protein BJF78_08060 [Pseudonocardia sp. CNS-139]